MSSDSDHDAFSEEVQAAPGETVETGGSEELESDWAAAEPEPELADLTDDRVHEDPEAEQLGAESADQGSVPETEAEPAPVGTPGAENVSGSVEVGSVKTGRDAKVVGTHIGDVIEGEAPEAAKFRGVPLDTSTRLERLFIAPDNYKKGLDFWRNKQKKENRDSQASISGILLIYGQEHAGKWTCAVNSALRLRGENGGAILHYIRPADSALMLTDVIQAEEVPEGAILILKDVFEGNLQENALGSELKDELAKKKVVLIGTTELQLAQLESLTTGKISARVSRRKEALKRHLELEQKEGNLSADLVKEVLQAWDDLGDFLRTPFYIWRFCEKLVNQALLDEGVVAPETFVKLARQTTQIGKRALRRWFDDLHHNDKFFGLLAYLFEGVDRDWLESLHRRLVRQLRKGGWDWLKDPRELGLEDSLAALQADESGGRVVFQDRSYKLEVCWQVGNRQHLLWGVFDSLVAELKEAKAWNESWKRRGLGAALGRLGLHEHGRFKATLDRLADTESKSIAVVAGYALQETLLVAPGPQAPLVSRVLSRWIRSCKPNLMWAAGAAVWKVYLAARSSEAVELRGRSLTEEALRLLELLASRVNDVDLDTAEKPGDGESKRSDHDRRPGNGDSRYKVIQSNIWCATDAIKRIALADPETGKDRLTAWATRGKAMPQIARQAIRTIFESLSTSRGKPSAEHKAPLLELVGPLLDIASDEAKDVRVVFLTLRGLLRWPEWGDLVSKTLLKVATQSDARCRERERIALTQLWLVEAPSVADGLAEELANPKKRDGYDARKATFLRFWLSDTGDSARRVAQAVIARSHAMEGAMLDVPNLGRGVLVFDPELLKPVQVDNKDEKNLEESEEEKKKRAKAQLRVKERGPAACWRLLTMLDCRVDLSVVRVGVGGHVSVESGDESLGDRKQGEENQGEENQADGNQGDRDKSDKKLQVLELAPDFPATLLMMPPLLAIPHRDPAVLMVVSGRKIHDFNDVLSEPWLEKLFLVAAGDVAYEAEGAEVFHTAWPPTDHQLTEIEEALEAHWARAVAEAPAEHWAEMLKGLGIETPDLAKAVDFLGSLADDLDNIDKARSHDDPARTILCLLCWYAATDLPACLELLASWLTGEGDERETVSRRSMGAAGSLALLKMHTAYPSRDASPAPTGLFEVLADPLSAYSPDGTEAVLRFVRHWMEDSYWSEYLAGGVRDGRCRLLRWAEKFLPERRELFDKYLQQLAKASEPEVPEHRWEALMAAVDQLRMRMRLGRPAALPVLEPGESYGLIVIDTAVADAGLRGHLAGLGADLYARLQREDKVPIVPAIYRMGERRPFCAGADPPPALSQLAPSGVRLAPLLGPMLSAGELAPNVVSFVLVLSDRGGADLPDWALSPWWEQIQLYPGGHTDGIDPRFAALPEPCSGATVEVLAQYLSQVHAIAGLPPEGRLFEDVLMPEADEGRA